VDRVPIRWNMDIKDYELLCEPMNREIRPILEGFCRVRGYRFFPKLALGRHPRMRIYKIRNSINYWFDLMQSWDVNGRYVDTFSVNNLHELCCGAFYEFDDGSQHGGRMDVVVSCFTRIRFCDLHEILLETLEKYKDIIEKWDRDYITREGEHVQLGAKSNVFDEERSSPRDENSQEG
jgi:hypothetical protein